MAPVRTAVVLPTGFQIDLIIPLSSETTFKTLQKSAIERAANYHSTDVSQVTNVLLRLDSRAGPFLHLDDKVEDVVSARGMVFVMLAESSGAENTFQDLLAEPSMNIARSTNEFQLRIITPHLAHCHQDIRTIPLLEDGKVFSGCLTLHELRGSIAKSLEINLEVENSSPRECNCKLAEIISGTPYASIEGSSKIFVVTDFSNVVCIENQEPTTYASILAHLREFLGENFEDAKSVHLKGGEHTENDRFTRLPVVSVCAKSRHSDVHQTATESFAATSTLDLHTAEGPIETPCHEFSVDKLGLTDIVVNGVLSIYAIERKVAQNAPETITRGKDAMFSVANHWVSFYCP
jgi:hypothetical protein